MTATRINENTGGQARILKGVGGQYELHRYEPPFRGISVPRGIFRKRNHAPLPGDLVTYESSGDPDIPWVITDIHERKNALIRPPMSNLDQLLITASAALPEPDYYLLDRLAAYAYRYHIEPVLLLNKLDRAADETVAYFTEYYRKSGFKIFYLTIEENDDLRALREYIAGKIVAFAGQSGVGKSTLINRLFGEDIMHIGALSEKGKRGRQTTRHIELFPDGDGYVADTPGFQTISLADLNMEGEDFAAGYPEIEEHRHACKFRSCRHINEPECALHDPEAMHPDRLARYQELREQLDEIQKNRY